MGEILTTGPHLQGVLLEPRLQIFDDRGAVMHALRADWPHFERFGEVYISLIKEGAVKAWKLHKSMTQHFVVPVGQIKLRLFDDRPDSSTRGGLQEIITGADRYGLVRLPPRIWYGFKGLCPGDSLIINCATHPHEAAEVERCHGTTLPVPVEW